MSDVKISLLGAALIAALSGCASGTSHPAAIESRTAARAEPQASAPVRVVPPADAPADAPANEPRVQALPDNQSPASMAVALPTPPVAGNQLDAPPAGGEGKPPTAGVRAAQ